jgi:hypothetical protein
MNKVGKTTVLMALALVMVMAMAWAFGATGALAASVEPIVIPGADNTNKTCDVLVPGSIELKIEPVPDGAYSDSDGLLTVNIVKPSTLAGSFNSFDFTSNIAVLGVIVKDGVDGANFYDYRPAGTLGDDYLTTPFDGDKGISHISFCYRPALSVTKDAETSFTRTWEWEIEKSVDPEIWDLFTGDSGTSDYLVEVTKTGFTDSDWAVAGSITIENNTPFAATITGVEDVVSPDIAAAVDCGVMFPYDLAAGGTLECSYSANLPDGSNRVNTATVSTSGPVDGGQAMADVIFGDPTTEVNASVNIEDTYAGFLGEVSDSDSFTYERTFFCDADEGQHDNTATIVETGQSADASVTVNCYALDVSKDANTSFTRTWTWDIVKSADQTDLLLAEGQLFQVNYEVMVSALSADSDWAVAGDIDVYNPAPIDATINGVADVVSPAIAADVDCGVAFPYQLLAGDTLSCSYSADLPDADDRVNTATATLQNFDYDSEGGATPSGTTDFSGDAAVAFDDADMTEIDECIDVNDTNVGFLGTVCAEDAPQTFYYSLWFGAHPDADVILECGENTHPNIASFETNDTATTGEDDHTVNAVVECVFGCSLTPGYWKTHSIYGPAPYDDTWALIGEDTPFFLSGQSYYEVLWTAPQGNAYYILAHAYIAAELNELNGADFTDAQAAFDAATALFETYTPEDVAGMKGPSGNALRAQFIELAQILDDYNNGLIGPGHCSE